MHRPRILITATLVLACGAALAQTTANSDGTSLEQDAAGIDQSVRSAGTKPVAGRIGGDFTAFAGSPDNATALVSGLRNGSAIELTSTDAQGKVTTVTVPATTKPMGYGNVTITLALAQTSLAKAGITQPTAGQLQAALSGGTVTLADGSSVKLQGIETLRASGMGWGQIAKTVGVRMGSVVSAVHDERVKLAATSGQGRERSATTIAREDGKADRGERGDKADRPEKVEKPERPERPEKPERASHGR
jgi:hypothetical protein